MDEQFEARLRGRLRDVANRVEVSPDLWALIRARHARESRRRMLSLATSLTIIVVVALAAVPVVLRIADRSDPAVIAGPVPSATASPTPGLSPAPDSLTLDQPPTGPVHQLRAGEVDGLDWSFVAYEWDDGICYGFPANETGGGAWCGGPNPLQLSGQVTPVVVNTGSGQGQPSFVYGPVRKDVASVRIELPDGQVTEVEPEGQRTGLPANFFVQAYRTGVSVEHPQVTALDADGQPLEAQAVTPAAPTTTPSTPGPRPTTPSTTVPPTVMPTTTTPVAP